jgi:hypothetical protein
LNLESLHDGRTSVVELRGRREREGREEEEKKGEKKRRRREERR